MKHSGAGDFLLREICFDFEAGMLDRPSFHRAVKAWLQRRMACDRVHIECRAKDLAARAIRLKESGWMDECVGEARHLHASVAHNGRLMAVLSCIREGGAAAWAPAEGVALRRYATTLASHFGRPLCEVASPEEQGASL